MPTADVNGVTLHYEIDGTGDPWFVLHGGLGVDAGIYRRTLAPLADSLQLISFDQRANGRSVPADLSTVTMEQLADDVAGLADALGIDRFSVLGHSYGGFVAQELVLRHPGRVARMILVDTTPGQLGTGEEESDEQGPPPPAELIALMQTPLASADDMAQLMGAMLPYYFPETNVAQVAPLFEGTTFRPDAMMRGFEVLAAWSSVDRLASVTAPTLLLAGRLDVFTSYPQSHRIAKRIPGAEVVVFEHSGHFPWIEEPDAFFATVRDWLARTS